jgi:hypothetical protein
MQIFISNMPLFTLLGSPLQALLSQGAPSSAAKRHCHDGAHWAAAKLSAAPAVVSNLQHMHEPQLSRPEGAPTPLMIPLPPLQQPVLDAPLQEPMTLPHTCYQQQQQQQQQQPLQQHHHHQQPFTMELPVSVSPRLGRYLVSCLRGAAKPHAGMHVHASCSMQVGMDCVLIIDSRTCWLCADAAPAAEASCAYQEVRSVRAASPYSDRCIV